MRKQDKTQPAKCYDCHKPVKKGVFICKKCSTKPLKTSSTLIIYHTV